MGDDKWKIIDTHLNSMMDWTNNLNTNASSAQQGNARGGHIHRRSEPDALMIRKAQQTRKNDDVPQSAPVQPGKFTLEWPAKPKKLPSADDVPTDDIINEIITGTQNLIDIPMPNDFDNSNHPDVWLSPKSTTFGDNKSLFSSNKTEHMLPRVTPSLTRSSTISEGTFKSAESQPKPPPYPRFQSRPLETVSSNNVFVPLSTAPETSSYNSFNTMKGPPVVNHFGYGSPRSTRRSSMPGNQIDPRAHSASPNITRRSTSHTASVNRRRTHDNLGFIPTITSIQNSDMESIPSHQPPAMDPRAMLATTQFVPISNTPLSPSVRCDDQEYTKALLQHQQERMQRLQKELNAKKELLESLSTTVSQMETEVFVHRNEKLSIHMPTLNDVTKLRAVNRQMEIDCNCMIKEIDMVSKSGNSVGGNFYENINRKGTSGSSMKKRQSILLNDLPSPPLPPPPVPPPLENDEETKWSCKWCTFLNHAALNKCEMCDYRRERVTAAS